MLRVSAFSLFIHAPFKYILASVWDQQSQKAQETVKKVVGHLRHLTQEKSKQYKGYFFLRDAVVPYWTLRKWNKLI